MQALLDLLGVFHTRSTRWIGLLVAVGAIVWFGADYLGRQSRFGAVADRLEAAMPAPLPGWSAPKFERKGEDADSVQVSGTYRKGGETLTVRIQSAVFVAPLKPDEFMAKASAIKDMVPSIEQAGGQTVFLSVSPVMSMGLTHVGNRAVVQATAIRLGAAPPPDTAVVRAEILGFLGAVNYRAIAEIVEPRR